MDKNQRSVSSILMQIALGCLFIVSGIWILQGGRGDEAAIAIRSIFDGNVENIVCIIFAVIELVAGVFLIMRLFVPLATSLDTLLMFIIMVTWIVAIVLIDFLGNGGILNGGAKNFLNWLYHFAYHLLVLGAIIRVKY